ncbi:hypothetical protein A3E39_02310 [Candidatus Uhrbacteria bacterium RIFCSPHIGHO2_12_FULL_60_25]|uniref:Uncharacterized protein n=1 Tax=Candidatus Uhrbacteria bacterium RIFCSPHIGHO2_12_FULL_60_25 TaxID=1802399 RepID=A0A1F7ULA2_9BACT|nr:MAG: hypothetical protein A3E39_02310 [Candidatus Uhrbacteria bacterium RIFCSPHIGHO2_12_FULL_60_25]
MQFELTDPAHDEYEYRLERLYHEIKRIADRINVIGSSDGYHLGLMCIGQTFEFSDDRSVCLREFSIATLVRQHAHFDLLYDPNLPTRRYVFKRIGTAYVTYRDEGHGQMHKFGSLGEGLIHILDHLRESLVLIRNETDEKIKAVMTLSDSLTGRKPVRPDSG